MSAHHEKIDGLQVFLVWLPVVFLGLGKWIIPDVGPAEFLIACAGWSNAVAVIAIARELNKDDKDKGDKGIGWWRTIAFIPALFLFPLILAWDLTHVLHQNTSAHWYFIIVGFIAAFILIIYKFAEGNIPSKMSPLIAVTFIAGIIGVGYFFIPSLEVTSKELTRSALGASGHWWVDQVVKRLHVWAHLVVIPLIYLVTDGLQYLIVKFESADKKMYRAFVFYDFIMLAVGGAFAAAGWYIVFPNGPDSPNLDNTVGVEEVAAAAILILWNIAYVHLYPTPPTSDGLPSQHVESDIVPPTGANGSAEVSLT